MVNLWVVWIWIWANTSSLFFEWVCLSVENVHCTCSAEKVVVDITFEPSDVWNDNCCQSLIWSAHCLQNKEIVRFSWGINCVCPSESVVSGCQVWVDFSRNGLWICNLSMLIKIDRKTWMKITLKWKNNEKFSKKNK